MNNHTQQQFAKMAGFGLNLKLVLYLQSQCLTESFGFLNPPLLQAANRYCAVNKNFTIYILITHQINYNLPFCVYLPQQLVYSTIQHAMSLNVQTTKSL